MIVSKTSWHYKLNNAFSSGSYTPRDLCSYFWRTVRSLILPFALVAFVGYGVWSVIQIVLDFIEDFWGTLLTGGIVIGIFLALMLLVVIAKRILRPIVRKGLRLSETLIGQYASAKKRRICPLIELED